MSSSVLMSCHGKQERYKLIRLVRLLALQGAVVDVLHVETFRILPDASLDKGFVLKT
jgi:hypothetical protein